MTADRVAGEAGCVGDAGQDGEVAPEVAGGVGEDGGKGAVSSPGLNRGVGFTSC
jgi:hypothetical protein